MSVRGNRPYRVRGQLQQQAVEVIADILVGHRELRVANQVTQVRDADRELRGGIEAAHAGELGRWQRGKHEAASPGLDFDLRRTRLELDDRFRRQAAANVEQFARWHRGGSLLADRCFAVHGDLDFHVRAEQVQTAVFRAHQHVAQDWQRLAPFDDVRDGLESG